jgi:hypothetical protein
MIIDSPMRNEGASPSRVGAAASLAVSLGYLIYMPELMDISGLSFFPAAFSAPSASLPLLTRACQPARLQVSVAICRPNQPGLTPRLRRLCHFSGFPPPQTYDLLKSCCPAASLVSLLFLPFGRVAFSDLHPIFFAASSELLC